MRPLRLHVLLAPMIARADFVPAPPEQGPGYSKTVLPCTVTRDKDGLERVRAERTDPHARRLSLRELAILRDTIYAHWG